MIDTSLDSSNFYFLIAVIQGIILSLLIFFRQPPKKPHRFLGVLIFLFSLSLLHLILEESIHAFNGKFPIPMDFGLAYGPLAYLHVCYIKDPRRRFTKKELLHFLPSLLLDGLFFSALFIYLRSHMDWAYAHIPLIQGVGLSMMFLTILQMGVYSWWVFKESQDAKVLLREFKKVQQWIKYMMLSWGTFICFLIIAIPIALYFIEQLDDHSAYLYKPLGSLIGICIYTIGYLYLLKYGKIIEAYIERVQKFKLNEEEMAAKKEELLQLLTHDKPYTDNSLTLASLAEQIGWPINQLSIIINESLHTNFNDLINKHRVDAFKLKVLEPDSQKYSILGLAKEAGFSSKASFYRAFKRETGLTPTDFVKTQK
ncbi:MAG: helix-turn-helix domain-containing protein [Bacteroidota bacterium]